MKENFKIKDKVLFLEDYDLENLSIGWIYTEEYSRGIEYWIIIKNEEDLEVDENLISRKYRLKKNFVIKSGNKKEYKYTKISVFLKKKFISKHCYTDGEKALLFLKNNNRIRIFFVALWNSIKLPGGYFLKVIVSGIIKLVIGDIFAYFANEHKMFLLKNTLKIAEYKDQAKFIFNDNTNNTESEVFRIKENITNLKKENIEINRALIATVIAIVSLIISLQ